MVKHIFLTCGVLLSATAQTAFAKELEGMLVTQNNYVRIRSCDLKNNYTLLPGSGNGYEAAAEIISVRKNTPENTPIYVGLRGNLENTNFLISGIDFIKMGESCHVPHTETPPAEVVIREYPLNQQKSGSTGRKPESKQDNAKLKATESQQAKAEQDKPEETAGKSEEPIPYPEVTQTNQSEDGKKSEGKSNSDDLVKESVKTEDVKQTDTEKSGRTNAGSATPEVSNTTAPTEKKTVENKEIDTSAKAETSETVEAPTKSEMSETVEVPAKAETHETVEAPIRFESLEKVETLPTKTEISATEETPAQTEAPATVETRVTTETTSTTQAPVAEEASTKSVDVEEHPSVSEPVAPVVLPAESQPVETTTVSELKPETGKQETPSVEHEPLAPQVDIQHEETHSAHNTLPATPMTTETSASQTEPPVVNEETSVQPVYVNKVIVHDDDAYE
jgi:putative polycomb group protein ASXL3